VSPSFKSVATTGSENYVLHCVKLKSEYISAIWSVLNALVLFACSSAVRVTRSIVLFACSSAVRVTRSIVLFACSSGVRVTRSIVLFACSSAFVFLVL
jgi:hypothetical protein